MPDYRALFLEYQDRCMRHELELSRLRGEIYRLIADKEQYQSYWNSSCNEIALLREKLVEASMKKERFNQRVDNANAVIRRYKKEMPEECFIRYFNVIANGKEMP